MTASQGLRGRLLELWQRLRGDRSPRALGVSVGLGLLVGCLPLYGFHLPLCLLACVPFRLDAGAAYLAAQISNPWFAPFLLALEARIGAIVLGRHSLTLSELSLNRLGDLFGRTFVGSVVVGGALGVVGGVAATLLARSRRGKLDA